PPYFTSRPTDITALAGDDVLLSCQAHGDPYPDVQWHRRGPDIDIHKAKILENVHPSDEGVYICEATNVRGSISSSAKLSILEIPIITVKPPASLIKPNNLDQISLDCFVTGTPHPLVFWTIESGATNKEVLLLPDSFVEQRISMNRDGSLVIKSPDVRDTGHYVCSSLNSVGSALSRSQLTDEPQVEEARLALLEKKFIDLSASSGTPKSIKMEWKLSPSPLYISDIHLLFRQHSSLPNKGYGVLAARLGRVHRACRGVRLSCIPSRAPKILKIRILNATAIFLAWDYVSREHHNGNIQGYQ
ncbi:Roundabout, partial [Caligus rogercresseyi]